MPEETKALIQQEQLEIFDFFEHACKRQTAAGYFFLFEQPKGSKLLKQKKALALKDVDADIPDYDLCMCCHGLKDKCNHKPHMKPTTLRGTVKLSKVVKWCICAPGEHQQLQGHNENGELRTHVAQECTWLYCYRLIDDFRAHLKTHKFIWSAFFPTDTDVVIETAFPGSTSSMRLREHEEQSEVDEETPDVVPTVETIDELERKARELRASRVVRTSDAPITRPPKPASVNRNPGTPIDLPSKPRVAWNPLDELASKWDLEEEEEE